MAADREAAFVVAWIVVTVATPRLRVESACQRLGRAEVIERCVALLDGGEADPEFVLSLGGAPAMRLLGDGTPDNQAYWLRVWAMRGLLWASPGGVSDALRRGLKDDHWRVREMTCRVIARHRVDDVLDAVAICESDSVVRVRRAARRAVMRIVESAPILNYRSMALDSSILLGLLWTCGPNDRRDN